MSHQDKSNQSKDTGYYLPEPSHWPLTGSVALFCIALGAANWLHQKIWGPYLFLLGAFILAYMLFGWFGTVIRENRSGITQTSKIERSFRYGMLWFIFTEVMFFGAFFGALFYARVLSVPWLGGSGHGVLTHLLEWPHFRAAWPVFTTPDPSAFMGPQSVMETWGLPAINTAILLTSGVTITIAHWGILKNKYMQTVIAQALTVALGIMFLFCQAHEYGIAYTEKGLKLSSGIFGTTFFMLTGFHAMHVTLGTIMLTVILYRVIRKDFDSHNHFAFEAVSWYWHFVDVVWLLLFVFVYWI